MNLSSPSTIALEIPEIVAAIGEFIPLWTLDSFLGRLRFNPRPLLTLSRVSKTWQRALVPIIWRVHCTSDMKSVPTAVLQSNSRYARLFFMDGICMDRRRWNSLYDTNYTALTIISKLNIVTQLSWSGLAERHTPPIMDVFKSVRTTLTTLWLYHTRLEPQKLFDILSILPCLTALTLISGSSQARMKSDCSLSLALPIRDLRTNLSDVDKLYFRQLLICSPDLEHLILCKESFFMGTLLQENILTVSLSQSLNLVRQLCPKIRTVKIKCEGMPWSISYQCSFSATVATLGPAQDQLVELEIALRMLEIPVIRMINCNADFLQVLKITLVDAVNISKDLENFKELISSRKLTSLRTLHFRSKVMMDEANTFSFFESERGCSTLESLSLDGLWCTKEVDVPLMSIDRETEVLEKVRFWQTAIG